MLAALQSDLVLVLANLAFETKDNLLGGLGLLVEDGFGLTTITGLLSVVTALTCLLDVDLLIAVHKCAFP